MSGVTDGSLLVIEWVYRGLVAQLPASAERSPFRRVAAFEALTQLSFEK
jgi:hypothetical protein